jgi:hypothetical protein
MKKAPESEADYALKAAEADPALSQIILQELSQYLGRLILTQLECDRFANGGGARFYV